MPNLVGIGNSQVPTNAMLGGLAYQDPEHTTLINADIENIAAIKAKINDSIVASNDTTGYFQNIFVYNTALDSDGGAWRKRCGHTSWYNEGASQYRGARKEFPSIAVITVTSTKITIYDGDDPNLSMWMLFEIDTGWGMDQKMIRGQTAHNVYMLNGILVDGAANVGSNYGQPVINFISERVVAMDSQGGTAGEGGVWAGNIADRNTDGHWKGTGSTWKDYDIGGSDVYSIGMIVEPGAPIDSETRLPIPTIIVGGFANGISIIKPEGVNFATAAERINVSRIHNRSTTTITGSGTNDSSTGVRSIVPFINKSGELNILASVEYSGSGGHGEIVVLDKTGLRLRYYGTDYANTTSPHLFFNGSWGRPRHYPSLVYNKGTWYSRYQTNSVTSADANGIIGVHEKPDAVGEGLVNYITNRYNSGWMPGDIQMACCCDTVAETVSSPQLGPNNSAASSAYLQTEANATAGWTNSGFATFESSNTRASSGSYSLHFVANGNGQAAYTSFATVVGETYSVRLKVWLAVRETTIKLGTSAVGNQYWETTPIGGARWNDVMGSFTATGTTAYLSVTEGSSGNNTDVYVDEVDICKADRNMAVGTPTPYELYTNKKFPMYRGTITKTPVAPGAELCGYSGFGSGYLQAYYTSDHSINLNLHNAAQYTLMGWQKITDIGNYSYMVSVYGHTGGNKVAGISINESGVGNAGAPYFYNNGGTTLHAGSDWRVDDGEWHHICAVMHSNDKYLYIDGQLAARDPDGGGSVDFTYMDAIHIGSYTADGTSMNYQHRGSIALVKVTRDYTSAAQIKKIYEDEKKLFAPNAKCTLYGSSDAAKSVAFDKVTETMHVGTPSGRSDFQGLRRINNTTTAVTSTISASGGLIAEQ